MIKRIGGENDRPRKGDVTMHQRQTEQALRPGGA
ncbi:hypothetical protein I8G32_02462 [Rhodopseudomonas palustris]|nr:hypothetical protein I8G32_02462 [Rhodopseudomonas palustris]